MPLVTKNQQLICITTEIWIKHCTQTQKSKSVQWELLSDNLIKCWASLLRNTKKPHDRRLYRYYGLIYYNSIVIIIVIIIVYFHLMMTYVSLVIWRTIHK